MGCGLESADTREHRQSTALSGRICDGWRHATDESQRDRDAASRPAVEQPGGVRHAALFHPPQPLPAAPAAARGLRRRRLRLLLRRCSLRHVRREGAAVEFRPDERGATELCGRREHTRFLRELSRQTRQALLFKIWERKWRTGLDMAAAATGEFQHKVPQPQNVHVHVAFTSLSLF